MGNDRRHFPFAVVAGACFFLGASCLATSYLWPRWYPATLYWNNDHEAQLETVNRLMHERVNRVRQAEQANEPLDPRLLAEYQDAVDQGNGLRAKAEVARERPRQLAARWRWAGAAAFAVGLGTWFLGNREAS